jgi:hypothetical protein
VKSTLKNKFEKEASLTCWGRLFNYVILFKIRIFKGPVMREQENSEEASCLRPPSWLMNARALSANIKRFLIRLNAQNLFWYYSIGEHR